VRNDQPVQPLAVEITHAPDLDPTRREYYVAENRQHRSWWTRVKPWVEAGGVGIAVILAILNLLTLWQTRKQTPAVIKSGDAAKEALTAVQRAFVYIDTFRASWNVGANGRPSGMRILPVFKNSGTTRAIDSQTALHDRSTDALRIGLAHDRDFHGQNLGRRIAALANRHGAIDLD
jgi:hypothetical protein